MGALIIAYPAVVLRNSVILALTGRSATKAEFLDAARVFKSLGDVAMLSGYVGLFFGGVHVMEHLDVPDKIGPGIAIALLSVLYGLLVQLFIGKALADSFRARAFPSAELTKIAIERDDLMIA